MSTDVTRSSPPDATRTGAGTAPLPPASPLDAPPGFVLDREIGSGGMGVVYLARQSGLNRVVALKTVRSGTTLDPRALIRFLAEAESIASVRHPNVVEVYAFGEHAGRPYLALEYCPGGDLTTVSKAEQTRDANWFRSTADLMAKIADGVNAAHAQGIVHRDLKPANVLLTADNTPKVTDFGLAKRGLGTDLTHTQDVLGTPAYMAPEQASGRTKFVGPEADVWALGVMLYELLSGTRPFDGSNPLEVMAAVAKADVPRLQVRFPAVPRDLALVTHKCLSADPRDRYPTAGALAADLRNWLDGKPVSARPAGVIESAVKWVQRNKRAALTGLGVLLVMATATGVSLGFGLEANSQRERAEQSAKRANDEVERTQQTLAKALLAPITSTSRRWEALSEYERNALWELAEVRDGPVGVMLVREATGGTLAGRQWRSRAEFLDHAVVGLDPRRRRAVDDLLTEALRDHDRPRELRRDVALAGAATGRCAGEDIAPPLLESLIMEGFRGVKLRVITEGLAEASEGLPADRKQKACERAVQSLLVALYSHSGSNNWLEHIQEASAALAAVWRWLPPQILAEYSKYVIKALAELQEKTYGFEREEMARAVVAVCERLPPSEGVEAITLALRRAETNAGAWYSDHERDTLAVGLAAVAAGLPADRAAEVCERTADQLATAVGSPSRRLEGRETAVAFVTVSRRLSKKRAAELGRKAAATLAARLGKEMVTFGVGEDRHTHLNGFDTGVTAEMLAEVCEVLPAEEAADVCGKAADVLLDVLRQEETLDKSRIVTGLAAVCRWLPPERAERVCEAAAALLLNWIHAWKGGGSETIFDTALGVAAVCRWLPADRATAHCDTATELLVPYLNGEHDPRDEGECAARLTAVVVRLPEERATAARTRMVELLVAGLGCALGEDWWQAMAKALRSAATGLDLEDLFHPEVRTGGAAGLPKPRPLPAQQLVELLKHPFVVKEARRGVLDALEFTYDRQFADLWEFVAFAEKEHPELDLLTPPRRPVR